MTDGGAWTHRLPAPLRAVCELAAFAWVLGVFSLAFLSTSAAGAVGMVVLPRRLRVPWGRAMIRRSFRFGLWVMEGTGLVRLDLHALDALTHERGLVVAPNHPSLLDVMLVASRVPNVVCILKADLWDNPLLGGSARLAGYIRNDAPVQLVRRASEALQGGANLLVFPEGTRTVGGVVGPFKGGFALMARQAGAPVQTVFIEAGTPYLGKGWPIWRKPPLPLVWRVRLGQRFQPAPPVAELHAYYVAELSPTPHPT